MPRQKSSQQPIIAVEQLTKKYGRFTAVNKLSFTVYEGEIFGLLGPNGAGKTTTLEILETLRPKTSGKVSIAGYDLDSEPSSIKAVIGVQLQAAGFYEPLSLAENLDLFAGLYNTHIDPIKILKKVGLGTKAKAKIKQLSGGQRQRFSIATTLVNNPAVVFLDEPTTGLDPQARRNLWDLIEELRAGGSTVVITTHYMDEAEVLCDRIGIMDNGQILQTNTPAGLIDNLLATGFKKQVDVKQATLEDVFLNLTGRELREEVWSG